MSANKCKNFQLNGVIQARDANECWIITWVTVGIQDTDILPGVLPHRVLAQDMPLLNTCQVGQLSIAPVEAR